jgi:hypothetical protein
MKTGLVALLVLAAATANAAGEPIIRVKMPAAQPILVGQQVQVDVQVLVPNFFMSSLELPTIDIPGATVTVPESGALNFNESIGGETYAGISRPLLIVPQRDGEFTLPPAQIKFRYAAEPGKPTDGTVTLPPEKFTAKLPAGAAAGGAAVPVAKVALKQTLDRSLDGLKVGDALTRTVEAYAANTRAMTIPPPHFDAPDSVRVYARDPVLTDETDGRGTFVGGRRVDSVTYTFEKAGNYTLPAIEVGWVDAASGKQEKSNVPEIRLTVAANAGARPEIAPEAPPSTETALGAIGWRQIAWPAAVLVVLTVVTISARRFGPRFAAWRAARRHAHEESEEAYFARVTRACAANDPAAAYGALQAWARRVGRGSLASIAATDADLCSELATLERRLYGKATSSSSWNGSALSAAAASARKMLLTDHRHTTAATALPALNP